MLRRVPWVAWMVVAMATLTATLVHLKSPPANLGNVHKSREVPLSQSGDGVPKGNKLQQACIRGFQASVPECMTSDYDTKSTFSLVNCALNSENVLRIGDTQRTGCDMFRQHMLSDLDAFVKIKCGHVDGLPASRSASCAKAIASSYNGWRRHV